MHNMMRIGLAGSAANPPQIGHLALLQGLVDSGEFEKILWIPCGRRSDKKGLAEACHRAEMTKIMLAKVRQRPGVDLVLREDDLFSENTPTIDWLERVARETPGAEVWWCTGSDAVMPDSEGRCEIERCWDRGEELIRNWPLLIIPRPGYKLPSFTRSYWNKFIKVKKLRVKMADVSSTLLRAKLMRKEDVSELTMPEIANYISRYQLYATQ